MAASSAGSWLVKIITVLLAVVGLISGIIQIVEYWNNKQNNPPACTTTGQTWTSPVDGMTLVCVPAGKFMMGAAASDTGAQTDERPQHEVNLSAFWIDKTEVTNAMYQQCVGAGKCAASRSYPRLNHPVTDVNWNDADTYCKWAGRSLPSEAQWEFAARGTDGRIYPWGNATPDANRANFNGNVVGGTTEVGKYPTGASPYGALDMAGNAREWVADGYGSYSSSPVSNPTGPASGPYRVMRGGSWYNDSWNVRASVRGGNYPDSRFILNGFRCGATMKSLE